MQVLKNTIWLTSASIISKGIAFFTVIIIARNLGIEQFGTYSLILTLIGFFTVFSNYGFDPLIIREIAQNPKNIHLYISNNIILKAIFSIVSFTVFLIFVYFLKNNVFIPFLILGCSYLVYHPLMTISSSFYGKEKMIWSAGVQVLGDLTRFILILYFLHKYVSVVTVVIAYAIANLIISLVLLLLVKHVIGLKLRIDPSFFKETIKEAFPFALNGLIFMMYFRIDIFLLSWLQGDAVVGTYSAAYRILDALLFIPAGIMGAIFPALSRKYKMSDANFWYSFEKIIKYLTIVGVPIGFAITALAPKIISLLYVGKQWEVSIIYLQVLIWTITLIFLNCSFPVALNATGKQKISALVLLFGTVFNISLNLLLIPILSAMGASISTVVTEISTIIIYLYMFRKNYSIKMFLYSLYKPLIASLFMVVTIITLYKFNILILILSGCLIYILSILILKTLDSEDYELLFPFLKKRNLPNHI